MFPLSRKTFFLAATGITLAIWVLSLMPLNQVGVPGGDKFHHFIAYASLMFAWRLVDANAAVRQQVRLALLLAAMGALIECAQGLTPYRFFEWADMLANSLGVLIGWALFNGIAAIRRRTTTPATPD